MNRRSFLVTVGAISTTGCIAAEFSGEDTLTEHVDVIDEERLKTCERQYIESEVITRDDETIERPLEPKVVETESQPAGTFVELETRFATVRSSEDAPDEHLDQLVTAYYLVGENALYRSSDADSDPRDGTELGC